MLVKRYVFFMFSACFKRILILHFFGWGLTWIHTNHQDFKVWMQKENEEAKKRVSEPCWSRDLISACFLHVSKEFLFFMSPLFFFWWRLTWIHTNHQGF